MKMSHFQNKALQISGVQDCLSIIQNLLCTLNKEFRIIFVLQYVYYNPPWIY